MDPKEGCLPYVDTQIGIPDVANRVRSLLEEEMNRMQNEGIPIREAEEFVGSEFVESEMKRVVEKAGNGETDESSGDRQTSLGRTESEQDRYASLIENQKLHLENLRLLEKHGKSAWLGYLKQLEALKKFVESERNESVKAVESVNRSRKDAQDAFSKDLIDLSKSIREQTRKNVTIALACAEIERSQSPQSS